MPWICGWCTPVTCNLRSASVSKWQEGKPVSLDRKLREIFSALEPRTLAVRERQECLALLARWYYSTWRDGEFVSFESFADAPYRKLVNAVSRVASTQRR